MAVSGLKAERHPLVYRVLHEIIMVSILILIVTGFYIHRPFIGGGGMLMALTRGVHFFAAGILMITVVLRLLGMFFGPYRDWSFFIGSSEDLKLMPKVIAHYLHLGPMPELKKKYNPLQMITYSGAFLFIIFQIISGFALLYPEGWFGWFNYGLFNNEIEARLAHYIVTWVFLLFLMIHVYLGVREGLQEMKEVHLMRRSEEVER